MESSSVFVKTVRWILALGFETSSVYGPLTDVMPVAGCVLGNTKGFFVRCGIPVFNSG